MINRSSAAGTVANDSLYMCAKQNWAEPLSIRS